VGEPAAWDGGAVLYPAPQLRLLILLALTLLLGLAVREWRAGFPDAAARFERFDRDDPAESLPPEPRPAGPGPAVAGAEAPGAVATAPAVAPISPPLEPLDVNRADAAQLARLPGVGPGLAQRIVEERQRRGRFDSPDQLRYVLGMGPKKLAAIRPFIAVSE
jgi:competence protein ComEA